MYINICGKALKSENPFDDFTKFATIFIVHRHFPKFSDINLSEFLNTSTLFFLFFYFFSKKANTLNHEKWNRNWVKQFRSP